MDCYYNLNLVELLMIRYKLVLLLKSFLAIVREAYLFLKKECRNAQHLRYLTQKKHWDNKKTFY